MIVIDLVNQCKPDEAGMANDAACESDDTLTMINHEIVAGFHPEMIPTKAHDLFVPTTYIIVHTIIK